MATLLACAVLPATPAAADLLDGLGGVTNTVTQTTGTVTGTITDTTGGVANTVVGAVDGSAGGALSDAAGGLTGAVGSTLGSLGRGPASTTTVNYLLSVLAGGKPPAGGTVVDARAPHVTFKVLSHLAMVGRNGKLKLKVTCDEPAVVTFGAAIRPGKGIRRHGRTLKPSRKLVKVPAAALGFRTAGSLKVTYVLSRKAQRALGQAKNGRIALQAFAVDVARNQARSHVKHSLKR
jgi:hypothetical protein